MGLPCVFALGPKRRTGVTLWSIIVIELQEILSATSVLILSSFSLLMHIRLAEIRKFITGLRSEHVHGRGVVVGRCAK